MGIPVRHTWWAIVAAAGLCATAAAQTGDYATDLDDHVAFDVASAAELNAASGVAAPLDLDPPPANLPDGYVMPYVPARNASTQDMREEADDPPIAGDVEIVDSAGPAPTTGAESVVIDASGQYVQDDWMYEDDSSFAWLISSGTWLHRGRWFGQAEATLVGRSTAPRQILSDVGLVFNNSLTSIFFSEAMTTESAGFGYEPGLRVTVGKYLGRDPANRDRTLEFSFWGLNAWTSQHAIEAVNPSNTLSLLRTPLNRGIGAFNYATRHEYTYESDLNSFEVNAKISRRLGRDRMVLTPDGRWERQCDPGKTPTFLAGFRTILIDEDFSFSGQRPAINNLFDPFANTLVNLPAAEGRYDISSQNRLFGIQLGAEMINQHCNWSWGVRGKLGGYANFVEQHSNINIQDTADFDPADGTDDLQSVVRPDVFASDVQLTFGAELGLMGTYQISPNVALRCAYDFIYFQGLALGPQQLDFNFAPTPNVRSGSHMFLNGGSVGLEVVW